MTSHFRWHFTLICCRVLVSNFTEEQLNRYEMFRRAAFPRAAIKRVKYLIRGKWDIVIGITSLVICNLFFKKLWLLFYWLHPFHIAMFQNDNTSLLFNMQKSYHRNLLHVFIHVQWIWKIFSIFWLFTLKCVKFIYKHYIPKLYLGDVT